MGLGLGLGLELHACLPASKLAAVMSAWFM